MPTKLWSADPEPPIGTRVLDNGGDAWERYDNGYWGQICLCDNDPLFDCYAGDSWEEWAQVAGNYGPVTIIETGT